MDAPFDLVKTQMQNQGVGRSLKSNDLSTLDMTRTIFRQNHVWSLYQGSYVTIQSHSYAMIIRFNMDFGAKYSDLWRFLLFKSLFD